MTLVPDVAEPVVVWRVWRVRDVDGPFELVSPVQSSPWPAREATAATCARGCGRVASRTCSCGLYGCHDPRTVVPDWGPGRVLGCTALWGRVSEHTVGARGEFGYPLVLFVHTVLPDARLERLIRFVEEEEGRPMDHGLPDQALVRRLADAYAVPVRGLRWPGHLRTPEGGRSLAAVAREAARGLAARSAGDPRAHDRLAAALDAVAAGAA